MDKLEKVLRSIDFNNDDKLYLLGKLNEYTTALKEEGFDFLYSKVYLNNDEGRLAIIDEYLEGCSVGKNFITDDRIKAVKANTELIFDYFEGVCNKNDDYVMYFDYNGIVTLNMENAREQLKEQLSYY